jgi:hypothetical protein
LKHYTSRNGYFFSTLFLKWRLTHGCFFAIASGAARDGVCQPGPNGGRPQWPDATDDEVGVGAIVYFDGIVVNVRGASGRVSQHTVYVALGVNLEGQKELLGLWLAETEGAKFWLSCLATAPRLRVSITCE